MKSRGCEERIALTFEWRALLAVLAGDFVGLVPRLSAVWLCFTFLALTSSFSQCWGDFLLFSSMKPGGLFCGSAIDVAACFLLICGSVLLDNSPRWAYSQWTHARQGPRLSPGNGPSPWRQYYLKSNIVQLSEGQYSLLFFPLVAKRQKPLEWAAFLFS